MNPKADHPTGDRDSQRSIARPRRTTDVEYPTLMRALLVPWGTSSLLFVGISSVLLVLAQNLGLLGW